MVMAGRRRCPDGRRRDRGRRRAARREAPRGVDRRWSAEEARCLPLSEIDFHLRPGLPNIVTYAAKWVDGSEEWGQNQVLCPAPLASGVAEAVEQTALAAYRAFGCRDYGRVDLRLRPSGEPVILEVNPNPDLAPTAGLARSATQLHWSYDELIHRILGSATARHLPGATPAA
jgi:D-alanine-D-alanine ligase